MKTVQSGNTTHYWKNTYAPNGTIVGTLTNNNAVISGFSDSNYLLVDKYPTNITSLEVCMKVKPTSIAKACFFGQKSNNYKTPQFYTSSSGSHPFEFAISQNGSSWTTITSSFVPTINTDYWVKGTWDGSYMELLYSTDGENFTSLGTKSCTKCTWTEGVRIGDDASSGDYWIGSIDLKESYIDVNNERWWDGAYISSRTEVTSSDPYDYTTTENIYKAVKQVERHYWKREETEQSWTQPVLSANGTIGGDSFACAANTEYIDNPAWKAFDSNANTDWQGANSYGLPNILEWYNPNPLNVTKIVFVTGLKEGSLTPIIYSCAKNYLVQASIDNTNWVDIYTGTNTSYSEKKSITVNISNNNFYKYWRIYVSSVNKGNFVDIWSVSVTATQLQETIVPGTAENYDFYTDETVYKGVNL